MTLATGRTRTPARQHGAMDHTAPPVDLDAVRMYRLGRVREELRWRDYAGIVLFDQLNTRYAIDATDMQIWCMHNEIRYAFVPTEGPVVLFDYPRAQHLADGMPTIDEVRPATAWCYAFSGTRLEEVARRWAHEIEDLVARHGGANRRLAVDRTGWAGLAALAERGIEIHDGFEVMESARRIKSPEEIVLMRCAIDVAARGMDAMREALRPGITENALWAKLHETNIACGGEWIETRLLASGPRTNPWFHECSMRAIEAGDIVSFDTDLVGPYGYCADVSRAWVCGEARPTAEQRRLYRLATDQVAHNVELMRAGVGFREVGERAWTIPGEFFANRYGCVVHGVGLCDEWPTIYHAADFEKAGFDGELEPGMVVCVESYLGAEGGHEGVKLEQQVLVTDGSPEVLSTYPYDDALLGREV